jgi:hypothetical protein
VTALLDRANASRRGGKAAQPHELWLLAEEASAGSATARRELFRHAMVHAGHLVEAATGVAYATCPTCGETLGRPL